MLKGLLGTTLAGGPFNTTTVDELASQLGTNSEGLAKNLSMQSSQLPGTAMALTAPLTNGEDLGVLNSLSGLSLALLGSAQEKVLEGVSGGSGAGSSGGSGGAGGNTGSTSGTPGGSTLVVNVPGTATASSSGAAAAKATTGKLKLISKKVRGHKVTLVVQVPAAGQLSLSGRGVRAVKAQTAKAERYTLRTALTKGSAASLRKHHRRMTVTLKAVFKPVGGSSSSATTSVVFR